MADEKKEEKPLKIFVLKILPFAIPVFVLACLYGAIQTTNRDGFLYKVANPTVESSLATTTNEVKEYNGKYKQQYSSKEITVIHDKPTHVEPVKEELNLNIIKYLIIFILLLYSIYHFRHHFKMKNKIKGKIDFESLINRLKVK